MDVMAVVMVVVMLVADLVSRSWLDISLLFLRPAARQQQGDQRSVARAECCDLFF